MKGLVVYISVWFKLIRIQNKKQEEWECTNSNVKNTFCKDILIYLVDTVLVENSINPTKKKYSRIKENEKNMETYKTIKNMRKIKAGENYLQNYCGEGN